jgi:hypothetical protein
MQLDGQEPQTRQLVRVAGPRASVLIAASPCIEHDRALIVRCSLLLEHSSRAIRILERDVAVRREERMVCSWKIRSNLSTVRTVADTNRYRSVCHEPLAKRYFFPCKSHNATFLHCIEQFAKIPRAHLSDLVASDSGCAPKQQISQPGYFHDLKESAQKRPDLASMRHRPEISSCFLIHSAY